MMQGWVRIDRLRQSRKAYYHVSQHDPAIPNPLLLQVEADVASFDMTCELRAW